MPDKNKTYFIGVPAYWGAIIPPLQHSLVGFGVIINQFEPLVRRGGNGLMEPLGAKEWTFSQDRRVLRFTIDTSRRFSDGSYLSAEDYKKSWENGLKMQPKSSNSALSDALSEVKGFSSAKQNGELEGVTVFGKDILEIKFKRPVRSAIEHLSGVRYSAYKEIKGQYIGTGPYVITEKDKELTLVPNKYYAGPAPRLKNVKIVVVPPAETVGKFKAGVLDAMLFAEKAGLGNCADKDIKCSFGQEGSHAEIILNGLGGRFFSEPRRRAAMQAVVWEYFKTHPAEWPQALKGNGFFLDSQSFLKFQAGRLPDSEAEAIIVRGAPYIKQLIADAKRTPLLVCSAANSTWLLDVLSKNGISVSDKSKTNLTEKDVLEMFYKKPEPDMLPLTISVYDGDPDCMYHVLGRHGAIFSPMLERKTVADMLEEGRKILAPEALAPFYQGVGKKILEEVPYVHLGYYYRSIAYNPSKIRINEKFMSRNNQSIVVFEPN